MGRLAAPFNEREIGACRGEIRFGRGQIGPYMARFVDLSVLSTNDSEHIEGVGLMGVEP
jgi:hypothetical protein